MPIEKITNLHGDVVDRYVAPLVTRTTDTYSLDIVKEHRRFYSTQLNELHVLNKKFQTDKDFESCKALKDVIKHFTQADKAATIVVNYFEKDIDLRTNNYPQDLYQYLDYEFNSLEQCYE